MANKNQTSPQASFSFDALMRALRYMLKNYGALFCFVVVCIAVSAYAINRSMLFTQILIDDYIEPMLASGSTDFSGLAGEIMKLGVILVVGILASYGFNRLMVTIGQGTMKKLTSWGQVQSCHPSVMMSVLSASSAESSMPMARARLAATDSPKPLPLAPRAESAW